MTPVSDCMRVGSKSSTSSLPCKFLAINCSLFKIYVDIILTLSPTCDKNNNYIDTLTALKMVNIISERSDDLVRGKETKNYPQRRLYRLN